MGKKVYGVHRIRTAAVFLVFALCLAAAGQPVRAFTPWSKEDGIYRNNTGSAIPGAVKKGIDVSHNQGEIDWDKVKASDVEFALLRCGMGENLAAQDDRQWARNAEECERLGIPYGVYLYSYADSEAKARGEAEHVLRLIEGRKLSYPIYYDLEQNSYVEKNTTAQYAKIAKAFCQVLEDRGYTVGIYSGKYWFETKLTDPYFDTKEKWVAHYSSACGYKKSYRIWQCTSQGTVEGITGNVDIDFLIEPAPATVSLSAKATAYNRQKLTWKKVSGAEGYEIYRGTSSGGTYTKIKTVSSGTTSLSVTAVTGRTYYYRARAFKKVNGGMVYGEFSPVGKAKSVLAKTSLGSVKRSSSKKVAVKWKKVTGASGYIIYYSPKKNGGYKKLAQVKKGSASSCKVSVKKGKKYYYKVRAYRKAGGITSYGAYSASKYCK